MLVRSGDAPFPDDTPPPFEKESEIENSTHKFSDNAAVSTYNIIHIRVGGIALGWKRIFLKG